MPDYEIVEWNEHNLDISANAFAQEAYGAAKWAFVSDWARLKVLFDHGGIYMDTDVQVLRRFDAFLQHRAFTGFETDEFIPTAVMGAEPEHPWIGELLEYYEGRPFLKSDGTMDLRTNVDIITTLGLENHGFVPNGQMQMLKHGVCIYPVEWFCQPKRSGRVRKITANVHAIHHFHGSWLPRGSRFKARVVRIVKDIFGSEGLRCLQKLKRWFQGGINR